METQFDDTTNISVDGSMYSLAAIQRTAHRFTGQFWIEISRRDDGFAVALKPRAQATNTDSLRQEFFTALLDESLREQILDQTREIRDTLVRKAFMGAQPARQAEK
ncbi:His-Xaa-Ser system protein HxsD [Solimonas sp. SE-A11]|uniref:His-Xaa-Ser system protein HxsD n=1 Tax=Solimonas sp. SE-A11 TaxID=3054954 RepID=UPI00259CE294|nr:His-Xaa-Ser system protein HxsD [Solimonas sp. SE-A11]MDM4772931.1 His-Xaa-Ser system protein HxsD [Solimonas sp. SE-A11]